MSGAICGFGTSQDFFTQRRPQRHPFGWFVLKAIMLIAILAIIARYLKGCMQ